MHKKDLKIKEAAICFSGQVNHLELCLPFIKKNLLDNLESYDIFCYAEDDKNLLKVKLLNPKEIKKIKSSQVDKLILPKLNTIDKENYINYIFPKSFRFNFRNIYQQLFKIKGSLLILEKYMKKNKTSYKYFIRIRFDFLPINSINPKKFKISKNEIITPSIKGLNTKYKINDMFAITSDFRTFKKYCQIYDHFEEIIKTKLKVKKTLIQQIYFRSEKYYSNFFFFFFNGLFKGKIARNLLGLFLSLPKLFYKEFKIKNRADLETVFYQYLISENKIVKDKPMDFIIVRSPMDGLLILG